MRAELDEVRTERLLLRRLRPDDLDAMLEIQTDPETNRFNPWPPDADKIKSDLNRWIAHWDATGVCYWMIEELASGKVVGYGGLRELEEDGERVLNLAYRLRPAVWGQGYAPEMARTAIAWAESNMPDVPLSVVTVPANGPSLRVAEKLGFTPYRQRVTDGVTEVLLRRTVSA